MKKKYQLRQLTLGQEANGPMYDHQDCKQAIDIYKDYFVDVGYNPPWVPYFVICDEKAVGICSFVSKPADGRVEIAYWTYSGFEGQGVASFSCEALVEIAKKHDDLVVITAKTAPAFGPSTSILLKNGFVQTRIVQDHEIGDAWEWVYQG